jgi:hypothetical protein
VQLRDRSIDVAFQGRKVLYGQSVYVVTSHFFLNPMRKALASMKKVEPQWQTSKNCPAEAPEGDS